MSLNRSLLRSWLGASTARLGPSCRPAAAFPSTSPLPARRSTSSSSSPPAESDEVSPRPSLYMIPALPRAHVPMPFPLCRTTRGCTFRRRLTHGSTSPSKTGALPAAATSALRITGRQNSADRLNPPDGRRLYKNTPAALPMLFLYRNSECVVLGRNQVRCPYHV
jgi:hypothetical protein